MAATRAIRDGQCDIALAGGADAIEPLFAAGFHKMHVLASDPDPNRACRPFDRSRKGFVFGEGAAIFVIERLGHALPRKASIYAEIKSATSLAQARYVTGVDAESDALEHLIRTTLARGDVKPRDIGYINAHGTGTVQNDAAEAIGIRRSLGPCADNVRVSATKSILGHMINAAGAAELAITTLALRDGFAPPTLNLENPDPVCTFDCVPQQGQIDRFQHAIKLSLAFGGHLVAMLLSRWNDAATGFSYPPASQLQLSTASALSHPESTLAAAFGGSAG
jgi:3-oxoacyl-(acyl-carrier-protein) synthase